MKKFIVLLTLLLLTPVAALSGAVVVGTTLVDNADLTSYTTASFTPALDDLLVVFVKGRVTLTRPSTMTDTQSGTYTNILALDGPGTNGTMYLFVRNSLTPNSSMTITWDCTGDTAGAAHIQVARVSGITRTGATAILQTATQSAQSASTTPAPTFSSSALTGNPTLGAVFNRTDPATMTAPTSWTERSDVGNTTPTTGTEWVSRDSGFTGTTITWGSTSASLFGSMIVEVDTSAVPTAARRPVTVY